MKKQYRKNTIVLALAVMLLACASGQAQTWINTGTSGNWSDTGNWDPATVPNAAGASVILNNYDNMHATDHGIFLDGADYTVGSITVANTANRQLFIKSSSSGRLVFQTSDLSASSFTWNPNVRAAILSVPIRLANDLNVIMDSSNTSTAFSQISAGITAHTAGLKTVTFSGTGSQPLTQNNAAVADGDGQVRIVHDSSTFVLTLGQFNNSYTGGTEIKSGRVDLANTALGTGKLELNGGDMRLTRSDTTFTYFNGPTELNANATINFSNADRQGYLGALSIVGDRTLTASGAAAGGNTLRFNATTLGGNATFNVTSGTSNPNTLLLQNAIADGGSGYAVTKTGTGILRLNAANTYSGNTTISEGTLRLGVNGTIANSPILHLGTGSTLQVTDKTAFTIGASQTLRGTGTLNAGAATVTIDGTLHPDANLTVIGSETLTLGSGATFLVDGSDTQHGKLEADGAVTITLDGTLKVRGDLKVGTYVLIDAPDGSVSGAFAAQDVTEFNSPQGTIEVTSKQVLYHVPAAGTVISIH